MKFINRLTVCLIVFIAFFISCKKEDNQHSSSCKVSKIYFYDSGAVDDSATYFYTGSRVTKIQFKQDEYITYEYNGDKVVRRNFISSGNATNPDFYDLITYNTDGTPSKMESFQRDNNTNFNYSRVEFEYNAGKLSKAILFENSGAGFAKSEEYIYAYTGNNITSLSTVTYPGGTQSGPVNYSYDTNGNYFTKQNAQFFFVDPFITLDEFNPLLLPLYFSANNVTALSGSGSTIPFTYTVDEKGNLKQVKAFGTTLLEYLYFCS